MARSESVSFDPTAPMVEDDKLNSVIGAAFPVAIPLGGVVEAEVRVPVGFDDPTVEWRITKGV